ncbi:hypothetical protein HY837_06980 [archaeon]|nr:hypothetical protein [archaeon]
MGSKTDFDTDLDEYLSQRSRKQFLHNVVQTFKSKSPSIKLNPEIEPYVELDEAALESSNENKKGFFSRLFGREEATVEFREVGPTKDELKFVAQVALDSIKKLPSEEVELFKVSAEFEKLKDILKRHSLIK